MSETSVNWVKPRLKSDRDFERTFLAKIGVADPKDGPYMRFMGNNSVLMIVFSREDEGPLFEKFCAAHSLSFDKGATERSFLNVNLQQLEAALGVRLPGEFY